MPQNTFPKGWNQEKINNLLNHYENQTEEEAVLEDELAYEDQTQTTIEIPIELLPTIRQLIALHDKESHKAANQGG